MVWNNLYPQKARHDQKIIMHLPMNKCFKSYPVLSFRKLPSMSRTVPSAKTTSSPGKEYKFQKEEIQ